MQNHKKTNGSTAKRICRLGALGTVLMAVSQVALAINVEVAEPPQAIGDQQLTIGPRTMTLPEGTWTFAAKTDSHMSSIRTMEKAPTYTAYAMQTDKNAMRAGVVLKLPTGSMGTNGWIDEPCKQEGAFFKDTLNSSFRAPACLMIFKRKSHLNQSTGELYVQAKQWADSSGVTIKGPFYEVAYFNFASNDYGWIRAYLPVTKSLDEEHVTAWAKTLPDALADFFAKRTRSATLPALPQ